MTHRNENRCLQTPEVLIVQSSEQNNPVLCENGRFKAFCQRITFKTTYSIFWSAIYPFPIHVRATLPHLIKKDKELSFNPNCLHMPFLKRFSDSVLIQILILGYIGSFIDET